MFSLPTPLSCVRQSISAVSPSEQRCACRSAERENHLPECVIDAGVRDSHEIHQPLHTQQQGAVRHSWYKYFSSNSVLLVALLVRSPLWDRGVTSPEVSELRRQVFPFQGSEKAVDLSALMDWTYLWIFAKITLSRSVFAKQSRYALTSCRTDAIISPLSIMPLLQSVR